MNNLCIGTYSLGGGFGQPPVALQDQIKKAKALGYDGIEFLESDLLDNTPADIRAWCAEAGVEPVSTHCDPNSMEKIIPIAAEVGVKQVITPQMAYSDVESAMAFGKKLDALGAMAREQYGIRVGYHNHTDEFWVEDGRYLEDHMLSACAPENVGIQLDAGWCAAAGVDPVEYIRANHGRVISIHVKENNRIIGAEKPKPAGEFKPPFEIGPDGQPVMNEETMRAMAQMRERMSIQCPMGDPASRIDWKALKEAVDSQNNGCRWVVEREYDYKDGDMEGCLREDAAWLTANL